ncbi:hypothetical protein HF324_25185 [Chitinophaga oryzae]|uniref:Uncharacterized protein n=1 Tax=Chitinophaga oryzae TaxID=2725414 RepID=A0ABX6LLF0_9BACT|nr:hypothetical protein HF324_25185 [Chitinophaga oryzae]
MAIFLGWQVTGFETGISDALLPCYAAFQEAPLLAARLIMLKAALNACFLATPLLRKLPLLAARLIMLKAALNACFLATPLLRKLPLPAARLIRLKAAFKCLLPGCVAFKKAPLLAARLIRLKAAFKCLLPGCVAFKKAPLLAARLIRLKAAFKCLLPGCAAFQEAPPAGSQGDHVESLYSRSCFPPGLLAGTYLLTGLPSCPLPRLSVIIIGKHPNSSPCSYPAVLTGIHQTISLLVMNPNRVL